MRHIRRYCRRPRTSSKSQPMIIIIRRPFPPLPFATPTLARKPQLLHRVNGPRPACTSTLQLRISSHFITFAMNEMKNGVHVELKPYLRINDIWLGIKMVDGSSSRSLCGHSRARCPSSLASHCYSSA